LLSYRQNYMEQKFIFTLHIERTKSGHYWGYITPMPNLSRVSGESLLDVGCQLVAQLSYMADEMPASWKLEVQTEIVLHVT
jgi:hypothetical protein